MDLVSPLKPSDLSRDSRKRGWISYRAESIERNFAFLARSTGFAATSISSLDHWIQLAVHVGQLILDRKVRSKLDLIAGRTHLPFVPSPDIAKKYCAPTLGSLLYDPPFFSSGWPWINLCHTVRVERSEAGWCRDGSLTRSSTQIRQPGGPEISRVLLNKGYGRMLVKRRVKIK